MVTTLLNTLKQHITNAILYIMLALHYYLRVLIPTVETSNDKSFIRGTDLIFMISKLQASLKFGSQNLLSVKSIG